MADIEIKRGYVVLPDNNVRFGIRITNTSDLAISDVEVILDYVDSLFKLEGERVQKLGNIPPSKTRTAEFVLKPLGCVHQVNIEALISYRDPKWEKHVVTMHPKEVHCVCPFLKGKAMPRAEFLKLSGTGHSAETGLNFKGVSVERLASYLVQTCKSRHHKVDDYSVDGGRMLYLASESIGEKAYYLLTALIKEDGGLTQVMLRVVSDKSHGLNGFLNETVAELRHLVSTVQSAQEIGFIKNEQVINIIDSVVQRSSFGGSGGAGEGSVNITDSLVQRTEFNAGEGRKVKEERLREEREKQERLKNERIEKEKLEKLRRQKEEEEKEELERVQRKAQEQAEKEHKERVEQEELRKKQEEEKEILRKQEAQKKVREEQENIAKKKSKTRTNVFMLAIVLGALFLGFMTFAPGSGDENIRTQAPMTSIRATPIQSGIKIIHMNGDDFNLAETQIMLNSNVYSPLCSYDQMFKKGDVITVDKHSGDFYLNGNLMDTNTPSTPFNVIGGTVIIQFIDLITGQMITDIELRGI